MIRNGGRFIVVTLCDHVMAFSTARRCSPNLSLRRRLVSPIYWILHLVHCIMYKQARIHDFEMGGEFL